MKRMYFCMWQFFPPISSPASYSVACLFESASAHVHTREEKKKVNWMCLCDTETCSPIEKSYELHNCFDRMLVRVCTRHFLHRLWLEKCVETRNMFQWQIRLVRRKPSFHSTFHHSIDNSNPTMCSYIFIFVLSVRMTHCRIFRFAPHSITFLLCSS